MRVLVTGGSGFIGRNLVDDLVRRGHEVTVFDRSHPEHPEVRHVTGDVRDADALGRAFAPAPDVVVHLAARTSVLESVTDPADTFAINVNGTSHVLEWARRTEAAQVVFASSNAVVGDVGTDTIVETRALRPLTPYGATKAAGEMLCSAYGASFDLHCTALRFSNVYGPGMTTKDSVLARIMKALLSGETFRVHGDGEQVRDYVFVDDVLAAVRHALDHPCSDVVTVGSGVSVSVNELVRLATEVADRPLAVEHVPPKPGEMPAIIVDVTKAEAWGWRPTVDLPEGVAATWADFAQNHSARAAANVLAAAPGPG